MQERGINSAIRLNSYRTEKKDRNKEGWIKLKESEDYQEGLKESEDYQEGLKERYKIEGEFGEAKK